MEWKLSEKVTLRHEGHIHGKEYLQNLTEMAKQKYICNSLGWNLFCNRGKYYPVVIFSFYILLNGISILEKWLQWRMDILLFYYKRTIIYILRR